MKIAIIASRAGPTCSGTINTTRGWPGWLETTSRGTSRLRVARWTDASTTGRAHTSTASDAISSMSMSCHEPRHVLTHLLRRCADTAKVGTHRRLHVKNDTLEQWGFERLRGKDDCRRENCKYRLLLKFTIKSISWPLLRNKSFFMTSQRTQHVPFSLSPARVLVHCGRSVQHRATLQEA